MVKICIADEEGEVSGYMDKKDVIHGCLNYITAHAFLLDGNGKLLLQKLRDDHEVSPGKFGSSVATCLRKGETPYDAVQRALENELDVYDLKLEFIGNTILKEGNRKKFMTLYSTIYDGRILPNTNYGLIYTEFVNMDIIREEIDKKSDKYTISFVHLFNEFEENIKRL